LKFHDIEVFEFRELSFEFLLRHGFKKGFKKNEMSN
jgi:hypothetical protein